MTKKILALSLILSSYLFAESNVNLAVKNGTCNGLTNEQASKFYDFIKTKGFPLDVEKQNIKVSNIPFENPNLCISKIDMNGFVLSILTDGTSFISSDILSMDGQPKPLFTQNEMMKNMELLQSKPNNSNKSNKFKGVPVSQDVLNLGQTYINDTSKPLEYFALDPVCPYCVMHMVSPEVLSGSNIKIVWTPLPMHPGAEIISVWLMKQTPETLKKYFEFMAESFKQQPNPNLVNYNSISLLTTIQSKLLQKEIEKNKYKTFSLNEKETQQFNQRKINETVKILNKIFKTKTKVSQKEVNDLVTTSNENMKKYKINGTPSLLILDVTKI